jgi:membrane protein implicated in regulation of membrane protease activity
MGDAAGGLLPYGSRRKRLELKRLGLSPSGGAVSDWQLWFVAAVLLIVAEMFTPGFWLASLAIGAGAAGVLALIPGVGAVLQTITFAVTSLASLAGVRPILVRRFQIGPGAGVRTNVDALLGKVGTVVERIGPGATGRVKVEGEDWRGAAYDEAVLEPGTRITVIQVDGTMLMVEKES